MDDNKEDFEFKYLTKLGIDITKLDMEKIKEKVEFLFEHNDNELFKHVDRTDSATQRLLCETVAKELQKIIDEQQKQEKEKEEQDEKEEQ